jgi:hypothetical protein
VPAGSFGPARAKANLIGSAQGLLDLARRKPARTKEERQRDADRIEQRAMVEMARRETARSEFSDRRANVQAMEEAARADPHDQYRVWLGRTDREYKLTEATNKGRRLIATHRSGEQQVTNAYNILEQRADELGETESQFWRNLERAEQTRQRIAGERQQLRIDEANERTRRNTFAGRIPGYVRGIFAS